MSRERDVRVMIQQTLQGTGEFDDNGVWLFAPEDLGEPTDEARVAFIEPVSTVISDLWDAQTDGGLIMTCTLRITFSCRASDPQARDDGVEQLLNVAQNALNGQVLISGFTLPALTRFQTWNWSPPGARPRPRSPFLAARSGDVGRGLAAGL